MKKNNYSSVLFIVLTLLLFAIILLLPVKILSNYVHETGHITEAKKQNISLTMEVFILNEPLSVLKFGRGQAVPFSEEDCNKFNILTKEDKVKITHAGVKYELFLFIPILIISFIMVILLIKNNKQNSILFYLLVSIIILLLITILVTLYFNVFSSNPLNDWNRFYLDCSKI